jgi:hypothetical protein
MKIDLRKISLMALAALLSSCTTTSLKSTWKSPDYHGGPVRKIAVLAVDEGSGYRPTFEGQFVAQLQQQGQPAFKTMDFMTLPEIKADKQAAAARFRAVGADSVLVVRLMDTVNQSSLVPATRTQTTVTTDSGSMGWFEYSTATYSSSDMQKNLKLNVYLETSLYDLQSEKKIWIAQTKTVLNEDTDRMAVIGPLVSTLVNALRTDGLIK